jgi:mono/diheme cytochrome c family protein
MRLTPFLVAMFAVPAMAHAQEAGNVSRGEVYARDRCAECHAIDRQTEYSPVRAAPRFERLANTPGMTGMALTAWLYSSHKTMPNLIVRGENLDDLVAYIRSLKKQPQSDEKPQPQGDAK